MRITTGHKVAEYLRTARRLSGLPLLAAAYEQGTLSTTHIRELTRVATPGTERYWLEAAEGRTTRKVEKMVAFTQAEAPPPGRRSAPGEHGALASEDCCDKTPGPPTAGNTPEEHPAAGPRAAGHHAGPGNSPPGDEAEVSRAPAFTDGTVPPALPGRRETPALPERPRSYREKFLLELESEEMAILGAALNKARKETGRCGRSALILHMARAFLETPQEERPAGFRAPGPYPARRGRGPLLPCRRAGEEALPGGSCCTTTSRPGFPGAPR